MKRLHRNDLFCWSSFNERLNIDFNSFAWIHPTGNLLIDPLPMSVHDLGHLRALGGASWILVTNRDHVRGAAELATVLGAQIAGPAAEREVFPIACARWLSDGDELLAGLRTIELAGSKSPGELALLLEETTLITGDLIRAHRAGALMLLRAEQGLKSEAEARGSVARLLTHRRIEAVLVGDGFCEFHDGWRRLEELYSQPQP